MPALSLSRFVNPWKHRREERQRQVDALRQRDGDTCRRCRRPIRFELPAGHDLGVRIEQMPGGGQAAADALASLCLTHGRCNAAGQDHTHIVFERLRPAREAELFVKARNKRRAA
jgi:hypothetical protein